MIVRINRGLPASGKSSDAMAEVEKDYANVIRINRDDIRKMLHDSVWLGKTTEKNVVMMRDSMIRTACKSRIPLVIVDDTNLSADVVKHIAKIAEFFGYGVEVKDFDTPIDECIRRDANRVGAAHVSEQVIRKMHKDFFKGGKFPENPLVNAIEVVKFEPYVPNPDLPDAVIFDADGTLFSHEGVRSPYDYTRVHLDAVREKVARMAKMHYEHGDIIIIASGREDSCYEATATAVHDIVPDFELFMRKTGDKRQDRVIKGELFDKYIRNNFNTHCVYDDRNQVVRLWRDELMLDCFQVNDGDF